MESIIFLGNIIEKEHQNSLLNIFTIIIIMIILFFGLRPRAYHISNNIQWLPDNNALQFKYPSLAYLDDFSSLRGQHSNDFTLSIGVKAANLELHGFKPILMIHDGDDKTQFSLWQWRSSLIIMNGDDYDYSKKTPRISALDILKDGKEAELVITSNQEGTRLFYDGTLILEEAKLQLLLPTAGEKIRLLLGNSVYGKHDWRGVISRLEFYGRVFSPEELNRSPWRQPGSLSEIKESNLLLQYTFDDVKGTVIRDHSGNGLDLQVPRRYVVLKKSFLSLARNDFKLNRRFVIDVALNVLGFIPLGGLLFLRVLRSNTALLKSSALLVLAGCFALSSSMEIAQAWLPQRASSTLDVVLNTLGAFIGIVISSIAFRYFHREKVTQQ